MWILWSAGAQFCISTPSMRRQCPGRANLDLHTADDLEGATCGATIRVDEASGEAAAAPTTKRHELRVTVEPMCRSACRGVALPPGPTRCAEATPATATRDTRGPGGSASIPTSAECVVPGAVDNAQALDSS